MEEMTDKQFDKILKMVSMILDGCKEDHPRTCGENHIMSILAYKGINGLNFIFVLIMIH